MENLYKRIDEVVDSIKESNEYISVIRIQEQMNNNTELMNLINEVKKIQKKYVKSNYDNKVKEELDALTDKLNNIPIYVEYNRYLEQVNVKIEYVKSYLNDYFYELFNK